MLAETTITIPTSFNTPEFQPLWAWVSAAATLWYATVALLMRFGGRGPRIWNDYAKYEAEQEQFNKTRDKDHQKHPMPPEVAVFGRLLLSPLEFLAWLPIKYGCLACIAPLMLATWVAKGPSKGPYKQPCTKCGEIIETPDRLPSHHLVCPKTIIEPGSPADAINNLSKAMVDAFVKAPNGGKS